MATSQDAIRRLTIQTSAPGADQAAASLHKVADAQDAVTVASQKTERATLNLDQKFGAIEKRYVATVRAQQEYDKTQRMVNAAVAQNPALQERANAVMAAASERLKAATGHLNDNAKSSGLARHELINLGRQAQDVGTMFAMGASPMQIFSSQAAQIFDVFASSKGTLSGFFQQATGWLGGFLTAGRLAFGGVTIAISGAALALNSYLDSQQKVNMSLTGAGRASGATAANINSAANAGASFGFSVGSARELASELAATGKIGVDMLTPIVKLGHDFATTFGVDDVAAAKMLAQAFADPVRGAEQLNDRLGFLDAAMQRQIASLVAQNRMYEAQQVLLTGVQGSLAKTAEVTGVWAQMWSGVRSSASDAFDKVGEKIANGLGLNKSLQQQADEIKSSIASYETGWGRIFGSKADLDLLKSDLERVNALLDKRAQATQNVAAAQASLRQQSIVMGQLPEVAQRQSMADQASVAGAVAEDPVAQRALGITQAQADRVRAILNQVKGDYKTTFEEIQQNSKIASDAVTAFSPSAKALIAARQATEQYRSSGGVDPAEKAKIAQDAYNLSLKQSVTALSEQARARELSANQNVASIQTEIDMVGKTIGQQAEMRANLQARQALEQQASQYRTAFDEAEYERLKKINAEIGRRQQMLAVKQLGSDIAFDRSQIGLNDNEAAANARLRYTFGDDASSAQAQFYKQQLLLNSSLREMNDLGRDASRGFATDFAGALRNGASAADAFGSAMSNALNKVSDKLMQMAVDNLWSSAFGGKAGGGLLGFLGVGGAASSAGTGLSLTGTGGLYADGGFTGPGSKYQPAGIVHAGEYVFSQSSVRRIGLGNLDRLHRGYADGGYVQPAQAANSNSSAPIIMQDNRTIHIGAGASQETVAQLRAELASDRAARYRDTVEIVKAARKARQL